MKRWSILLTVLVTLASVALLYDRAVAPDGIDRDREHEIEQPIETIEEVPASTVGDPLPTATAAWSSSNTS